MRSIRKAGTTSLGFAYKRGWTAETDSSPTPPPPPGTRSAALPYKLDDQVRTLLYSITAPRRTSVAHAHKPDSQVQTLPHLTTPARKPSPLFISRFGQVIRACTRQHRKHPESPRPLAVAPRHIRGSPHRPPRIGVVEATPLLRDRPRPFSPPGPRPHSPATATAQQPHYLSPPQPRPAPEQHRLGAGLPRKRCSRAPTAPHRTPASRRASSATQPPRATPQPPLRGGTERGSRCAGRPATQATRERSSR